MTVIADKRVKIETDILCDICYENFATSKLHARHFAKEHLVRFGTFGCSSCAEQYADYQENQLHHDEEHKKKHVAYKCRHCPKKIFNLDKFNAHVETCVDPFYSTVNVVENITCAKCKCQFETKNLFDWHGCFIANKRPCPKCKRVFVKRTTLWRHLFACNAIPGPETEAFAASQIVVQIPSTNISADLKRPMKTPKMPPAPKHKMSISFKEEPESILGPENTLDPIAGSLNLFQPIDNALDTIVSPGSMAGDGDDLYGFDAVNDGMLETHFGDDADSDAEPNDHIESYETTERIKASSLPACEVKLELIDFAEFSATIINNMGILEENEKELEEDAYGDDDFAGDARDEADFDDEIEQPVDEAIASATDVQPLAPEESATIDAVPSTSQTVAVRQPLTMRIKREVTHPGYGEVVFNPNVARNIKREKGSQLQCSNARKSTAKPTYTIVHSNVSTTSGGQIFDPILARNIKREKGSTCQQEIARKSTPNDVAQTVSRPINENTTGSLFNPVLARNIKKERGTDINQRITARKSTSKPSHTATTSTPLFDPILARNIKREISWQQNEINSAISVAGPSNAASGSQTFDPDIARNIKREKCVEKQLKSTLKPNPMAVRPLTENPPKPSKKLYKMPALLALKIQQERMARERSTMSGESTSNSSTSSLPIITQIHHSISDTHSNGTQLPIISDVVSGTNLETLTSDGNEHLSISEQTSETTEFIPFKPIRISSVFKNLPSISPPPSSNEASSSTAVANIADVHSPEQEVPLTISKVVSLTPTDAAESLISVSDPNKIQPKNVECDSNSNDNANANTETNSDTQDNVIDPKSLQLDEANIDEENYENDITGWIESNEDNIQQTFDIHANDGQHSTKSLASEQQHENDFQSNLSVENNTIIASLEAIEQIVTDLEKMDNNIFAENKNELLSDLPVAHDDGCIDVSLPLHSPELESPNEADQSDEIDMNTQANEFDQKNSVLPLDEIEEINRDSVNAVCEMEGSHQQIDNVEKSIQNEIAVQIEGRAAAQNAADRKNPVELDDISEDSLGFTDFV